VLPYCSPCPGPRSVLILDNASIHKSTRLRELCEQYGVELRFLPPYPPDYNPIEATFNDIKAWIKRNQRLVKDFEGFESFLHFAVSQVCGTHAGAHFREAGYVVD
jgi:transposase